MGVEPGPRVILMECAHALRGIRPPQVDPHSDYDFVGALDQDPTHLGPTCQQVVGPFQADTLQPTGRRHTCHQRERAEIVDWRAESERDRESPGRRQPRRSTPPSARRLSLGGDHNRKTVQFGSGQVLSRCDLFCPHLQIGCSHLVS